MVPAPRLSVLRGDAGSAFRSRDQRRTVSGDNGTVGADVAQELAWLTRAIELAGDNADVGARPFGATIALDGKLVGEGVNQCDVDNDPTAHAEVMAIRAATRRLATPRLDGAVLAASTEPCPMCQAAALLAGVSRVIFATTDLEAAERGYDAREVLADLSRPFSQRRVMAVHHYAVDSESLPYERAAAMCHPATEGDGPCI